MNGWLTRPGPAVFIREPPLLAAALGRHFGGGGVCKSWAASPVVLQVDLDLQGSERRAKGLALSPGEATRTGWKRVRSSPKPLWTGCAKACGEYKLQVRTVCL